MSEDSYLEDDGGQSSDFIAVEAPDHNGHKQALWVGVRPTWLASEPSDEPVVQICYQEEHMASPLQGPVFLSAATWRKLRDAVDRRLEPDQEPS